MFPLRRARTLTFSWLGVVADISKRLQGPPVRRQCGHTLTRTRSRTPLFWPWWWIWGVSCFLSSRMLSVVPPALRRLWCPREAILDVPAVPPLVLTRVDVAVLAASPSVPSCPKLFRWLSLRLRAVQSPSPSPPQSRDSPARVSGGIHEIRDSREGPSFRNSRWPGSHFLSEGFLNQLLHCTRTNIALYCLVLSCSDII